MRRGLVWKGLGLDSTGLGWSTNFCMYSKQYRQHNGFTKKKKKEHIPAYHKLGGKGKYSDTSANEDNSFQCRIR